MITYKMKRDGKTFSVSLQVSGIDRIARKYNLTTDYLKGELQKIEKGVNSYGYKDAQEMGAVIIEGVRKLRIESDEIDVKM